MFSKKIQTHAAFWLVQPTRYAIIMGNDANMSFLIISSIFARSLAVTCSDLDKSILLPCCAAAKENFEILLISNVLMIFNIITLTSVDYFMVISEIAQSF